MSENQKRTLGLINRLYGKVEIDRAMSTMGSICVWLPIFDGRLPLRAIFIGVNGRIF